MSLDRSTESLLEGAHVGESIRGTSPLRLEDRPCGGTCVMMGGDEIGTVIDCSLDAEWPAGISDYILLQIAYHMGRGNLYAPPSFIPAYLPTVPLRGMARIELPHLQIRYKDARPGMSTSYSGPFIVREWRAGCMYPALWNNDNKTRQQMAV